jgi:hypothetical protein
MPGDLTSERERLHQAVAAAERDMLAAGLRDRAAFDRAWEARQAALGELERLDWLQRAQREAARAAAP